MQRHALPAAAALRASLAALPIAAVGLALAFASLTGPAAAMTDARFKAALKRVDPSARLQQICDYAAVKRIGQDQNPYHPDRAMIDSIAPVSIHGNTARGAGGAFRSRGEWYQFSFTCTASPDRLEIVSFDYKIGAKIPPDHWEAYGLYR
ncbi:MAG TPA: DUF930 domain-containing protein [Pseudolabrys sp.]|nr:DUF930 domain-containing protein [Pseudolabrys sp.]